MRPDLETTEQFDRDIKKLGKRHPDETAAVLFNLDIYITALEDAAHPKLVNLGFMHPEPLGIIAIDQKGRSIEGRKRAKMKETRLYLYAILESNKILLLTVGTKDTQSKDIAFAKKTVKALE